MSKIYPIYNLDLTKRPTGNQTVYNFKDKMNTSHHTKSPIPSFPERNKKIKNGKENKDKKTKEPICI